MECVLLYRRQEVALKLPITSHHFSPITGKPCRYWSDLGDGLSRLPSVQTTCSGSSGCTVVCTLVRLGGQAQETSPLKPTITIIITITTTPSLIRSAAGEHCLSAKTQRNRN
uniref:Uncharacterized protein n=1 Tax=Astyanax mexicanus TaxID=7994 RepID=A0A8B9HR83_ASTMX